MEWTEADFDTLSWHDNHVHGIRVEVDNVKHGTGLLLLDFDYILEWISSDDRTSRFRISRATLLFREVHDLRIGIDWAAATAAVTPFSISGIHRSSPSDVGGQNSWSWTIPVNWPTGEISFQSPGFLMTTRGHEIVTSEQCLGHDERTIQ